MDKRLTVSFDPETRKALKALASKMERSEGWVVRLAVKQLLETISKDDVQLELNLEMESEIETYRQPPRE